MGWVQGARPWRPHATHMRPLRLTAWTAVGGHEHGWWARALIPCASSTEDDGAARDARARLSHAPDSDGRLPLQLAHFGEHLVHSGTPLRIDGEHPLNELDKGGRVVTVGGELWPADDAQV